MALIAECDLKNDDYVGEMFDVCLNPPTCRPLDYEFEILATET